MSSRLMTLLAVTVSFFVLTAVAIMDVGYFGILAPHFRSWGGAQVFTDLVILALLACIWMWNDAGERGLPAWPFIVVTLVAGSFGPLLYLLARELHLTRATRTPHPSA